MLAQYFIMRYEDCSIEFLSSSHKLKQFRSKDAEETAKSTYDENKKDSVMFCSQILEKNPLLTKWRTCMEVKKKDDYADCFLQGLWYLSSKKRISYAEDLKINVLSLS
jgi:hypothetical protein